MLADVHTVPGNGSAASGVTESSSHWLLISEVVCPRRGEAKRGERRGKKGEEKGGRGGEREGKEGTFYSVFAPLMGTPVSERRKYGKYTT